MERTNADLAREVIQILMRIRGERRATGPNDPVLDEAAALIAQGLKREGFISELLRQSDSAGIELDARQVSEVLIAGVQAQRR